MINIQKDEDNLDIHTQDFQFESDIHGKYFYLYLKRHLVKMFYISDEKINWFLNIEAGKSISKNTKEKIIEFQAMVLNKYEDKEFENIDTLVEILSKLPGVYVWISETEKKIYVGQGQFISRIKSHKKNNNIKWADPLFLRK
ncbi:hypothetical protein [Mesomycoplasma hyorhinis]|uniref:hypothetical protein n=1 Tax=Mesomycoplasma hyorhinis TaxID=2100 RepID=UPI003DA590E6